MAKNTGNKNKGKAGLAAAAAGAAIVGAGAYYLLGPNKKEHQKKAKKLMDKMRTEAVREAKRAKAITMPIYHRAVDAVSDAYAKEYKVHEKDIKAIAQKLKGEWKDVKSAAGKAAKSTGAKVKKVANTKRSKRKK